MEFFILFQEDSSQVGGPQIITVYRDSDNALAALRERANGFDPVVWVDDNHFQCGDFSAWVENRNTED